MIALLIFMFGRPGPYLMPMPVVDAMMWASSSNIFVYLPILTVGLIAGIVGLWSSSHRRLAVIGLALAVSSILVTVPVLYVGLALV